MMLLAQLGELVATWLVVSIGAYAIHLSAGVLSVGRREVARQVRTFVDDAGYRGLAVHVLTAGMFPRGYDVE